MKLLKILLLCRLMKQHAVPARKEFSLKLNDKTICERCRRGLKRASYGRWVTDDEK